MTKTTIQAPFHADHVGSFLRTDAIKKARKAYFNGEIDKKRLTEVENEEIEKLVQKQIESGLKSITDGEFRREYWHLDFLAGLQGVDWLEAEYENRFKGPSPKNKAIKLTGQIGFDGHEMIDHFTFLKDTVEKYGDGSQVAKFSIPSPNMLVTRYQADEYYNGNFDAIIEDTIAAYKKAIQAFYEAGCRYLQLDDTSWSDFIDKKRIKDAEEKYGRSVQDLIESRIRTINEAIAGRPDDFVITMHICRGNFRSTYFAERGYDNISDAIFAELDLDGLFLEYDDERSGDFEPLKSFTRGNQKVVLGLITSKFPELEDADRIRERIKEATQYIPLENLALSPQCGFSSTEEGNLLTEEEQWKKIEHVVQIAESVWGKI